MTCRAGRVLRLPERGPFSLVGDVVFAATGQFYERWKWRAASSSRWACTTPATAWKASLSRRARCRTCAAAAAGAADAQTLLPVALAAGVNASISDMAQYLIAQTGHRPTCCRHRCWPPACAPDRDARRTARCAWRRTRLSSAGYALGWRVFDHAGHDLVFHGGAVQAIAARWPCCRHRDLGIAILWNSESALPSGLLPTIIDSALGLAGGQWLDEEVVAPEPTIDANRPATPRASMLRRRAHLRNKPAGSSKVRLPGRTALRIRNRDPSQAQPAARRAQRALAVPRHKKPLPPGQQEGQLRCSDCLAGCPGQCVGHHRAGIAGMATGLAFFAAFLAAGFFAAFLAAGFFAALLGGGLFATFLAAGFFRDLLGSLLQQARPSSQPFLAAGFFATFFTAFWRPASSWQPSSQPSSRRASSRPSPPSGSRLLRSLLYSFLTAVVWLLVNGYIGKAQFQKTPRVSDRRIDRRRARRTGPDGLACDPSQCRPRRPALNKNPRRWTQQVSTMGAS